MVFEVRSRLLTHHVELLLEDLLCLLLLFLSQVSIDLSFFELDLYPLLVLAEVLISLLVWEVTLLQ